MTEALAEQWGMPVINLLETTIPPKVLELVPQTMSEIYKIMPISLKDSILTVAMAEPQNLEALDDLRNFLGYEVRGAVSNAKDVEAAISRYYADREDSIEDVIGQLEDDDLDNPDRGFDLSSDEEMADAAPIRKLLNMVYYWQFAIRQATFTSSHLKMSSRFVCVLMGCCTKWFPRLVTWRMRWSLVSKLWQTLISPNAVFLKTVASN